LSKIREKSLTIWAKSKKIQAEWRPTLFDFKKRCTTFAEKRMKAFFGGHPKKVFHDLCGRKTICRPKSHKKVAGKLGDFWAKILRNP